MTPFIKLAKKIIVDDPRNLVCYVTLTVIESLGITDNIFVVRYTPPISPNDQGGKSFYNVAYVDQLEDLKTDPEDKYSPCFLLAHTVTKSFQNREVAERWCSEIYDEVKRLLRTADLIYGDSITSTVDIYKETHIESDPVISDGGTEEVGDFGSYAITRDSVEIDENGEVVNLTFDGKEVTQ